MIEWQQAMKTFEPRRIIPDQVPIDLEWVGDASLTGIGVLIGSRWAQFDLIKGWNEDETQIIPHHNWLWISVSIVMWSLKE